LLVWALNPEVCHMAVAVRPYAIGTSMVLASTWALLRWLDHPSKHRWLGYCALAAAPFYFSYFWALLLLPHAAYALYVYWSRRSVPGLQLILAPAIILLLWFPLLPAFWAAHQTQQLHGIPTPVFLVSFFQSVFPPSYSTGLLAALLLSACISRASIRPQGSGAELLLVSVWAAAPAAALYGAAKLTHLSLFTPKYLLVTAPATALLFSMMLNRHVPLRVFQFGALLIVTVGMFGAIIPWKETLSLRPPKAVEDWRGASRFTSSLLRQEDLPVLATSIFYEGATYPFPVSDSDRDCLLAPLSTYPIGKSPILIPPELHEWNLEYVADVVARMAATKGFLLYTHDNVGALFAQNKGVPWMFYSFAKDFQWQTIYKGGLVEVLRFYRR